MVTFEMGWLFPVLEWVSYKKEVVDIECWVVEQTVVKWEDSCFSTEAKIGTSGEDQL